VDIDESLLFTDADLRALAGYSDPVYDPRLLNLLFVYGTMQRGCQNHGRLHRPGVEFAGTGMTRSNYTLGMTENDRLALFITSFPRNAHVVGELYYVPGNVLHDLDMCEGHPDVYVRRRKDIWILFDIDSEAQDLTDVPDSSGQPRYIAIANAVGGEIVYTRRSVWTYQLRLKHWKNTHNDPSISNPTDSTIRYHSGSRMQDKCSVCCQTP
jgi:gamma-glutamylcyclotransferase (GGCT)/AIG2-like uncharacterized protein YtfP